MEDPRKNKTNSFNSPKIHDKKQSLKPSCNSLTTTVISNKNYSINTNRKKRGRHELSIKVTCSNCQTISFYQTGDYVKCTKCNSNRFNT